MGRKSQGEYPAEWPAIAQQVKQAAGWCCVRCQHEHNPDLGYCLTVHHLDLNKSNCSWWNLAALCQRCHLHIQAKVDMAQIWGLDHTGWFKPYVAGYYAHQYRLPEDYQNVMDNMDDLILLGQGQLVVADFKVISCSSKNHPAHDRSSCWACENEGRLVGGVSTRTP